MISFLQFLSENQSIGKKMGNDLYVHKDYEHLLPKDELEKAKSHLPADHKYTAVKYNKKDKSFSFIHSPDFDTAHEPTVGKSIKVHQNGETKVTNPSKDPLIWHHKHQWVDSDPKSPTHYKGFDTEESKRRSKEWRDLVGVNKEVSSRIGRKSYWEKHIVPQLKEHP